MNRPLPITGATKHVVPHRPEGADVPQSLTSFAGNHQQVHANSPVPNGGAGKPANASTYSADAHYASVRAELIAQGHGTGPRCITCRRNVSMCHCDSPEAEAEWFEPGLNLDPERSSFGMLPSGWNRVEL